MEDNSSTKLTVLFEEHHAEILAYCVRRIGYAEGEDAAAEVFSVASRRVEEIDWTTVRPWLYGVARWVLANRRRSLHRLQRMRRRMTGLRADPFDSPDDIVIRSAEAHETISALRQLRPLDREILMLYAWEDLGASEIAATFGVSVDAAKKRLERAKRRLALVLHPPFDSLGAPGAVFKEGTSQ